MKKLAIGLMTGTSLDGIDTVLIELNGAGKDTKYKELIFREYDIPSHIKNRIMESCSIEKSNVQIISSLNFSLSQLYSDSVINIINEYGISKDQVSFIGSHGQTIWHNPTEENMFLPSTFQLGSPSYISHKTGITTVGNFRVADMAMGGQGAPLVPYVDYILFSSKSKGRILQNIGGIGNLTFLPKNSSANDVIGFDTGPGNMIIDEICKIKKSINYDKDGYFASKGKVVSSILNEMMNHEFIKKDIPKSTGREEFGQEFTLNFLSKYYSYKTEDLIATATMFTAKSIVYHYEKFIFKLGNVDEIIINGGGAYNKTLIKYLKELLPDKKILTGEEFGIRANSKEAIAFAILANETLNNSHSNLKNVTGAKKEAILGEISIGKKHIIKER